MGLLTSGAQALAINDAYRTANKWWLRDFGGAAIEYKGEMTTIAGQEPIHLPDDQYPLYGPLKCDVLTITPVGGKPFERRLLPDGHAVAVLDRRWRRRQAGPVATAVRPVALAP